MASSQTTTLTKDTFRHWGYDTPFLSLAGIKTYARVVSLYDGDTLTLVLPAFNSMYKFNCRIAGIDTCEIKSKDQANRDRATAARDRMLELITGIRVPPSTSKKDIQKLLASDTFLVYVECLEFEKYGRLMVNLYPSPDSMIHSHSFANVLIQEKLAYPYAGGTKLTEQEQDTTLA